ncbi:MAG TPA: FHA domain-containing protein [Oligoflexia bacterium]|nr:FHA domain-containing protein [Oligoflexia bacterium]HMR25512.1 FHA domain-containing protein [Oligoflexia bacterium]
MYNDSCWHLIGKSGALKNKKITLIGPEIIIGRTDENDIVIPEHAVSRNHAKLEFKDNSLWLTDLKSKNGTYINQQKISTQRVKEQDVFQIGEAKALFKLTLLESAQQQASFKQKINSWLKQKNNRLLTSAIFFTVPILLQLVFFHPRWPEKPPQNNTPVNEMLANSTPDIISTEIPPTQSVENAADRFTPTEIPSQETPSVSASSSPEEASQDLDINNLKQDLTSALSLEDYPAAHKILKEMTQLEPSQYNMDQLAFVEKTLKNKIAQYEENALREYEKLNYDKAITEWQKALSLAKNLDEDLSRKIQSQIKEAQDKFTGK